MDLVRRVRKTVAIGVATAAAFLAAGRAEASEPLNPPAPLLRLAGGTSPGTGALALAAAQRAHDLGLSSVAVALYRQMLDAAGADRTGLRLALATALLDAGRVAEAEQALAAVLEPRGAAWHLRAGLAATQLRKLEVARAELAATREDELPAADYPWYWFLQGELVDLAQVRDITRANDFYHRAEAGAPTELARARFQLAAERLRLQLGAPSDADVKAARDNYERFQGREFGYASAQTYAVMLDALGRKAQAVTFLQSVLAGLPRQEKAWWDQLRLVLGLIGDRSRGGAGRNALSQLLEGGNNPERQRQALQLLAEASRDDLVGRGQFRAELSRLIAPGKHPILESLYLYRAQLALSEKDFAVADQDANAVLNQFPGSPLRVHAFGLLTQSAWEQRRYRLAADNARKARAELGAPATAPAIAGPAVSAAASTRTGRARADLGMLEAEAWFRAGDFRNAADAYAAVLRERPPGLDGRRVGELMFQRVLAEIKSGSPDAARVLDAMESDPAFDLENRWQAEWSLARALQVQGKTAEGYARVTRLLTPGAGEAGPSAPLKPELRARMAWLQARLAFEEGQAEQTLQLVDALMAAPGEVEAALKMEIASNAILLKARAEFALGREPAALETLKRLRADYPKADAAIYSYLIESDYYANQEKIAEAQIRLTSLTDNPEYKNSEYVPYALFKLALLSERLGQEKNLQEANRRIEELVNSPAAADLVFAARLKQGDLLRKMGQFPQAQRAYDDLVYRYAQRPDIVLAQLALAECHNAQSSADPSHADSAQLLFEHLRDRVDAPVDVRVEAGYNLGALLARRGEQAKALDVWWRDVITPFLLDDKTPVELAAKRPYWLARTLLDLGALLEQQERLEEAKRAYRLLLEKKLGYGEALAQARLERFGVTAAAR